jgi:hypothetical protein
MSKKGRRQSKKNKSSTRPAARSVAPSRAESAKTTAIETSDPNRAAPAPAAESVPAPAPEPATTPEDSEVSVPPASDLDVRFFEQLPSESWLAHELELRDPRLLLKMTAGVARRRARLVRYVVGVVGVAAALGVAALVKTAAGLGDEPALRERAAAGLQVPSDSPGPSPGTARSDQASNPAGSGDEPRPAAWVDDDGG